MVSLKQCKINLIKLENNIVRITINNDYATYLRIFVIFI